MIEQKRKKSAIFCAYMVDFHRPSYICMYKFICICVYTLCVYICLVVCGCVYCVHIIHIIHVCSACISCYEFTVNMERFAGLNFCGLHINFLYSQTGWARF